MVNVSRCSFDHDVSPSWFPAYPAVVDEMAVEMILHAACADHLTTMMTMDSAFHGRVVLDLYHHRQTFSDVDCVKASLVAPCLSHVVRGDDVLYYRPREQ